MLLAAIVLALPGTLTRAGQALRGRRLDIHVLMVVAVIGALLIDEWFEAAAVVVLFGIAQWLETRSLERARRAVREVLTIVPEMAEVRGSDGTAVLHAEHRHALVLETFHRAVIAAVYAMAQPALVLRIGVPCPAPFQWKR